MPCIMSKATGLAVVSTIVASVNFVKEIALFFLLTFQRKQKEIAKIKGDIYLVLARTCLNCDNFKL